MKLFIDTSSSEKIVVGLDKLKFEATSKQEKSQKLLPFISSVLYEQGKSFSDIQKIEVIEGPGSYTGLRVGIAVANALAWVLNIKVNGHKSVTPKYEEYKP